MAEPSKLSVNITLYDILFDFRENCQLLFEFQKAKEDNVAELPGGWSLTTVKYHHTSLLRSKNKTETACSD